MRRCIESGLMVAGLGFLGLFGLRYLKFREFQRSTLFTGQSSRTVDVVSPITNQHPVIGRISIRRLDFRVAMVEGDDDASLELAAGHMPGTALAGLPGNMIVAGHRDSAFWPLRNIREGDRIEVEGGKTAIYRVQQSWVVEPNNVSALANTTDATLTLVTCYPFRHVGPAPQRFIVRAKLIKVE